MKKILLLSLLLISKLSFAQSIPADSAKNYIGQEVTIIDSVTSTYQTKGEHPTQMLYFGEAYPHQSFTIVIFQTDWAKFAYEPSTFLLHKKIRVTGKVILYKTKIEIILKQPAQLYIYP